MERARGDFPETGGQLSQTVPNPPAAGKTWAVYSIDLIGVSTEIGRVTAPDYDTALSLARDQFPELTLLVTIAPEKSRKQKDSKHRRFR